jgi:hypothetical protein
MNIRVSVGAALLRRAKKALRGELRLDEAEFACFALGAAAFGGRGSWAEGGEIAGMTDAGPGSGRSRANVLGCGGSRIFDKSAISGTPR